MIATYMPVMGAAVVSCSLFTDFDGLSDPTSVVEAGVAETSTGDDASTVPDAADGSVVADAGDLSRDLLAYWSFDEGMGTLVQDQSGHGHTGAFRGAPSWTAGKFGGALAFDGVQDWIDVLTSEELNFGTHPFSVAAWVEPARRGSPGIILSHGVVGTCCLADGYPGYSLGAWNAPMAMRLEDIANGINTREAFAPAPTIGVWTHLVGVRRADLLLLYYNGKVVSATGVGPDYDVTTDKQVLIGALWAYENDGGAKPFAGKIDEVRIYGRALSDDDVVQLYEHAP